MIEHRGATQISFHYWYILTYSLISRRLYASNTPSTIYYNLNITLILVQNVIGRQLGYVKLCWNTSRNRGRCWHKIYSLNAAKIFLLDIPLRTMQNKLIGWIDEGHEQLSWLDMCQFSYSSQWFDVGVALSQSLREYFVNVVSFRMLKGYMQKVGLNSFSWQLRIKASHNYMHEAVCHIPNECFQLDISAHFHGSQKLHLVYYTENRERFG